MADVSGAPFAPNNTGVPTPSTYALGRAALFFAELDANDDPDGDGWIHMGNAPGASLDISREYLEHFSSIEGVRNMDARIPISEGFTVRFSLEELNEKNAEMFFSGESEALTNAAIAGWSKYSMVSAVELGRRYEVKNSSGVQAYGFDPSDLALEENSGATALVEGTDYTVDSAAGEILILSTATNIADGETLDATLTAGGSLNTMRRTKIMSRETFDVSFKIIGESPVTGRKYKIWVPKVSISADGGLDLITAQDLVATPLMATALKKTGSELGYIIPLPPAISS